MNCVLNFKKLFLFMSLACSALATVPAVAGPLQTGDFFGGGVAHFGDSPFAGPYAGLTAPYSIHVAIADSTQTAGALALTIDNSLSSSGAFFLELVIANDSSVRVTDSEGHDIGTGHCAETSCQLDFTLSTYNSIGTPMQIIYSIVMSTLNSETVTQIGTVKDPAGRVIYALNDTLTK